MPEISRFLGIIISMYFDEHNPPHFHAKYGEYRVTVYINSGKTLGEFPKKELNLVLKWLCLNKEELLKDWDLASQKKNLNKIKPL